MDGGGCRHGTDDSFKNQWSTFGRLASRVSARKDSARSIIPRIFVRVMESISKVAWGLASKIFSQLI